MGCIAVSKCLITYIYITGEIYSNWVVIELVVTLLLTCDASSYLSGLMSFNFGLLNLFRAKAQHMLRLSTDGTVSHLSINIICYLVRPCTEFVVFWTNISHPHAIVERGLADKTSVFCECLPTQPEGQFPEKCPCLK